MSKVNKKSVQRNSRKVERNHVLIPQRTVVEVFEDKTVITDQGMRQKNNILYRQPRDESESEQNEDDKVSFKSSAAFPFENGELVKIDLNTEENQSINDQKNAEIKTDNPEPVETEIFPEKNLENAQPLS